MTSKPHEPTASIKRNSTTPSPKQGQGGPLHKYKKGTSSPSPVPSYRGSLTSARSSDAVLNKSAETTRLIKQSNYLNQINVYKKPVPTHGSLTPTEPVDSKLIDTNQVNPYSAIYSKSVPSESTPVLWPARRNDGDYEIEMGNVDLIPITQSSPVHRLRKQILDDIIPSPALKRPSVLELDKEEQRCVTIQDIGKRVVVSGVKVGTLMYCGHVVSKTGLFCGVALDQAFGYHDGQYQGLRYFKCEPNHGLLVPIEKVQLLFELSLEKVTPISLHKQNSLECDESLGILTPDQMVDFAQRLDTMHGENDSNILSPFLMAPIFSEKLISSDHEPQFILDPDSEASEDLLSRAMGLSKSYPKVQDASDPTLSPEDLPMDPPSTIISGSPGPSRSQVPPTSVVTSVTSIGSLDTDGYQGDGELSRPASRNTCPSPNIIIMQKAVSKMKTSVDPMTDSDFFTESSDADDLAAVRGGDRRAQVIDGTLYNNNNNNNANNTNISQHQRCPSFTAESINEAEMESSGIFSDVEKKPDEIERTVVNSPDVSTSKSELSQVVPDEAMEIGEEVPVEAKRVEVQVTKVAKEVLKKHPMPNRNVGSKVKALLEAQALANASTEDDSTTPTRLVQRKVAPGRWDAVMNQIESHRVRTRTVTPHRAPHRTAKKQRDVDRDLIVARVSSPNDLTNSNNINCASPTHSVSSVKKIQRDVSTVSGSSSTNGTTSTNNDRNTSLNSLNCASPTTRPREAPSKRHPRLPPPHVVLTSNKRLHLSATPPLRASKEKNASVDEPIMKTPLQRRRNDKHKLRGDHNRFAGGAGTKPSADSTGSRPGAIVPSVPSLEVAIQQCNEQPVVQASPPASVKSKTDSVQAEKDQLLHDARQNETQAKLALDEMIAKLRRLEESANEQETNHISEKKNLESKLELYTSLHAESELKCRELQRDFDALLESQAESESKYRELQDAHDLLLKSHRDTEAQCKEIQEAHDLLLEVQAEAETKYRDLQLESESSLLLAQKRSKKMEDQFAALQTESEAKYKELQQQYESLHLTSRRSRKLEVEADSWKSALELRQADIAELRQKNETLLGVAEDLILAKKRISAQQARMEDLELQVKHKEEEKRRISIDHKKLLESFHRKSLSVKRLSQTNEELQWKLKQTPDVLTLVSHSPESFSPKQEVSTEIGASSTTPSAPLGTDLADVAVAKLLDINNLVGSSYAMLRDPLDESWELPAYNYDNDLPPCLSPLGPDFHPSSMPKDAGGEAMISEETSEEETSSQQSSDD